MIGGGSWGTAFARLLAMAGHETTLVCRDRDQAHAVATHHRNPRYLFDVELPATLGAAWLEDAELSSAELVAMAVPSRWFAETLRAAGAAAGRRCRPAVADQGARPGHPPPHERGAGDGRAP